MSFIVNITPEEAQSTGPSAIFGTEKAPAGLYPVKITNLSVSRVGGYDEVLGTETPAVYTLRVLLSHADKENGARYASLNYSVKIMGAETFVSPKSGETKTINLQKNLVRFLRDIGLSADQVSGQVALTATEEEFRALNPADAWKGVKTDILVGGLSVREYAKSVILKAAVKNGKKAGSTFVDGIFI